MKGKLCKIASYLNQEEMKKFKLMLAGRGLTESMFIREMLGFDVRKRGAPKGKREQTSKTNGKKKAAAGTAKSRSLKRGAEKKGDKSSRGCVVRDELELLDFESHPIEQPG